MRVLGKASREIWGFLRPLLEFAVWKNNFQIIRPFKNIQISFCRIEKERHLGSRCLVRPTPDQWKHPAICLANRLNGNSVLSLFPMYEMSGCKFLRSMGMGHGLVRISKRSIRWLVLAAALSRGHEPSDLGFP